MNEINFKKLVSYFESKDDNIIIEYVEELDFDSDKHLKWIYEHHYYNGRYANKYIFKTIENSMFNIFLPWTDSTDGDNVNFLGAKRNFLYVKSTIQSVLENGRLSIPLTLCAKSTKSIIQKSLGMDDEQKQKYLEGGRWNTQPLSSIYEIKNKGKKLEVSRFESVSNYKILYDLHPGHFALQVLSQLGIKKIPSVIFHDVNDGLDFGGIKINSADEYVDVIVDDMMSVKNPLTDIDTICLVVDKLQESPTHDTDFYNISEIIYPLFEDIASKESSWYGSEKLNIAGDNIITNYTGYHRFVFLSDPPPAYAKIAQNTFPLKVFIGRCKNENDFKRCKKRILKSLDDIFSGEYYETGDSKYKLIRRKKQSPVNDKWLSLEFYKCDYDIYDIPKKNLGFCIYTDSDVLWKKSIFDLLFFTHSKKIIAKNDTNKVVVFNCQHPFWEYNGNVDEIKQKDINILPNIYIYI